MTSTQVSDFDIPAHIPPELVRIIGLTESEEFLASPHDFMAKMHGELPPIFYDPSGVRAQWLLTKYEDCFHVLRHPELFSTEDATPFPRDPSNYFYFIPLEIDPPHHRKYRSVLTEQFSPQGVARLEGYIRDLSNRLIDGFIEQGECDFTTEFGRPLPVSVFLDLMGLPQEKRDTFVSWAVGLLHSGSREIAGKCMMDIAAYLAEVIAEKTQSPDDGVVSQIAHAAPGGEPLTEREIFGFVFFLFIGGLDTVFATLNNIFLWLANNPDRRQEIIDNPDNISNVVEELLRVFSVTFSGRTATQDLELRGVSIKKGDKITSVLPTANYDPDIFDNPTEVNFNRPRRPILAFAGGVHSCMGAHLARLEIKICIEEFLRRIPNFKVKEGAEIAYWPGGVIGPKSLPLTW